MLSARDPADKGIVECADSCSASLGMKSAASDSRGSSAYHFASFGFHCKHRSLMLVSTGFVPRIIICKAFCII